MKSTGPRTEPWDTPEVTGWDLDKNKFSWMNEYNLALLVGYFLLTGAQSGEFPLQELIKVGGLDVHLAIFKNRQIPV